VLLVGIAGTQLDVSMIRRKATAATRVSLLSLIIPLGLGVATAYLLPSSIYPSGVNRTVFALLLGVALAVSSIPIIAKIFADMNLLHRDVAQLSLLAAMVDDTVGWLLLSIVSAMATIGVNLGVVSMNLLYLGGVIVAAATVGRPLVRIALLAAAKSTEPGPSITTTVIIILLGASLTRLSRSCGVDVPGQEDGVDFCGCGLVGLSGPISGGDLECSRFY